jgi:hypothetical protein
MMEDHPVRTTGEAVIYVGAITYPAWVQWFDSPAAHAVTWVGGFVALVLLGYCRLLDAKIKRATLRKFESAEEK